MSFIFSLEYFPAPVISSGGWPASQTTDIDDFMTSNNYAKSRLFNQQRQLCRIHIGTIKFPI